MIAAIAQCRSNLVAIIFSGTVSCDFWIEEEVIILIGYSVRGFTVKSFSNEAKGLELAEHR